MGEEVKIKYLEFKIDLRIYRKYEWNMIGVIIETIEGLETIFLL